MTQLGRIVLQKFDQCIVAPTQRKEKQPSCKDATRKKGDTTKFHARLNAQTTSNEAKISQWHRKARTSTAQCQARKTGEIKEKVAEKQPKVYLQPYYKSYVRHKQKHQHTQEGTPHFQALCRVDNGVQEEPRPVWLVAKPRAFGRAKANAHHWYHSIAASNFIVIVEDSFRKKMRSIGPLPKIS